METAMPIYEYVCTACGSAHEILQRISDDPATVCPSCGASALTKQVSAAGFRLKGGGWYETDFKSGNKHHLVGDAGKEESRAGTEGKVAESKTAESKTAESKTPEQGGAPASTADSKSASAGGATVDA